MWSVGAILFELLNGYPPFQGRTNVQVVMFFCLYCEPVAAFSNHSFFISFSALEEHQVRCRPTVFADCLTKDTSRLL